MRHLQAGKAARSLALSDDERKQVATYGLLTAKPVLYCCNVGETDLPNGNAWSDTVRARAAGRGRRRRDPVRQGRGRARRARRGRSRRATARRTASTEPALATLARECYRLLGLQSYFTAGEKEIRAWTIRKGALAPEAAGVIHTDFEKGFIRAQVYSLADLEQYHTEAAIKAAGKMRMEGKDYVVAGRRHHALPVQRLIDIRCATCARDPCHDARSSCQSTIPPISPAMFGSPCGGSVDLQVLRVAAAEVEVARVPDRQDLRDHLVDPVVPLLLADPCAAPWPPTYSS